MPIAYLLKTKENVASFKARFNIPRDVEILYCDEGAIEDQKHPHVVFFSMMSILEGDVRFLVDPLRSLISRSSTSSFAPISSCITTGS